MSAKADDFDEVYHRVNACEGVKAHFLFVDCKMPWTNKIDVYFMLWENGSVVRSKLSCLTRRCLNLWAYCAIRDYFSTYVTEVWMVEMTSNDGFESIHSCRMNCNVVIPFDKRLEHGVRKKTT